MIRNGHSVLLIFAATFFASEIYAQAVIATDVEVKKKSALSEADLAKKLSNPVSDLISIPFQFNWAGRIGPASKGNQVYLNFEPVVPIHINQDWNIISRTVAPIIFQNHLAPKLGSQFGLGNIEQSFFLSPTNPVDGIVYGAGPVFYLPSATDKLLGNSQTGAGPTAVALKIDGSWTYGALVNQIWGFAGPVSYGSKPINQLYFQPFVSYTTKDAWTFFAQLETQYDWTTRKWILPIDIGVNKLVTVNDMPISFGLALRYFAATPYEGPKGIGAQASITFLLPEK